MTVQLVSRAVVVIALLMLTANNCAKARAQGADELASLRTQVDQLYSQGKYAEAAPIAERYVRRFPPSRRCASSARKATPTAR
jgi:hypothetical protein